MEEADGALLICITQWPVSAGAQVLPGGPSQGFCPHPGDSFPCCAPSAGVVVAPTLTGPLMPQQIWLFPSTLPIPLKCSFH